MRPTVLASDLHLSPDRPALAAAFRAFCAGPARGAAAVYLLGDLFDWWIGDDQLREPFDASIAEALRGVARAGVPVRIAHGNRDFMLGTRFAAATGAAFLPEQIVVDLHGTPTLLSHGDELCTGDVEYQRFRARMRDPATQRRLLRLPRFVRSAIARGLRRRSRDATALKPEAILDVDPDAVAGAFRRFGVTRMIHGHTHRPATHRIEVDGAPRERIVLPDWHETARYVRVDGGGVDVVDVGEWGMGNRE
ncbi:MAG TPA: UDP-2,3-diacylglucosamine diphosphatase [Casimicrobiaceae bacterium]|nr:UDP-2,3-diacylglucosamine diphosphatase [Casimicrobiaceae bacterium]